MNITGDHFYEYLELSDRQRFLFAVLYYFLVAATFCFNVFFLWKISRRFICENSCFFVHYVVIFVSTNNIQIIYSALILHDPVSFVTNTPMKYVLLTPLLRYAIGLYLTMIQYFTFYVIVFSKIVSLTFKRRIHQEVWSERVAVFAFFVQFFFPAIFVTAFVLDDPGIELNGVNFLASNKELFYQYTKLRWAIGTSVLPVTSLPLLLMWIHRVRWHWGYPVVHRMRMPVVTKEGHDGQIPVYYRMSIRHQEDYYVLILFIHTLVIYFEILHFHNGFAYYSPSELFLNCISSMAFSAMIMASWSIPTLCKWSDDYKRMMNKKRRTSQESSVLYSVSASIGIREDTS